jgi:hypothetical protein
MIRKAERAEPARESQLVGGAFWGCAKGRAARPWSAGRAAARTRNLTLQKRVSPVPISTSPMQDTRGSLTFPVIATVLWEQSVADIQIHDALRPCGWQVTVSGCALSVSPVILNHAI